MRRTARRPAAARTMHTVEPGEDPVVVHTLTSACGPMARADGLRGGGGCYAPSDARSRSRCRRRAATGPSCRTSWPCRNARRRACAPSFHCPLAGVLPDFAGRVQPRGHLQQLAFGRNPFVMGHERGADHVRDPATDPAREGIEQRDGESESSTMLRRNHVLTSTQGGRARGILRCVWHRRPSGPLLPRETMATLPWCQG